MYGQIFNPSSDRTMVATLRIPGESPKVHRLPPHKTPYTHGLPTMGPVQWHLWTLEWESPPREGLMRFRR